LNIKTELELIMVKCKFCVRFGWQRTKGHRERL